MRQNKKLKEVGDRDKETRGERQSEKVEAKQEQYR